MEIIDDLSHLFDGFLIDLTNIGAGDKTSPDKVELIHYFEQLLNQQLTPVGKTEAANAVKVMVPEATVSQYHTGL